MGATYCRITTGWILCLLVSTVGGQEVVHYDIDFSSPPHTVDLIPSTGTGSDRPSSIPLGQPAVVSSYGTLTNQPLCFMRLPICIKYD